MHKQITNQVAWTQLLTGVAPKIYVPTGYIGVGSVYATQTYTQHQQYLQTPDNGVGGFDDSN